MVQHLAHQRSSWLHPLNYIVMWIMSICHKFNMLHVKTLQNTLWCKKKAGFKTVICHPFTSPVLSLTLCYVSLNWIMCFQWDLVLFTAQNGWGLCQQPQVMDRSLLWVGCKRGRNGRVDKTVQHCLEMTAFNFCLWHWVSYVRLSDFVALNLCSQPRIACAVFCLCWDAYAKVPSFCNNCGWSTVATIWM